MISLELTVDETRAVLGKLAGWVIDGPELEYLQDAERKMVAAMQLQQEGAE